MSPPTSSADFLLLVRRSGLIGEELLDAYWEYLQLQQAAPDSARALAERMVQDGVLTKLQANQLLQGKYRGFLVAGKYKLLELLGSGGMGSVLLCEHVYMGRLVALKILPINANDTEAVERFYREARAIAALDHPNIVRAYDVDRNDKVHFLVMEYVDGVSLHQLVKRHGPLEIRRAAHYIAQTAAGLEHAYEAGWVHRDIKPGNLLLSRQGVVKILDMGLARFFEERYELTKRYDENAVIGTADYISPEQATTPYEVDIRSDIYSLGATFYFLLTGRAPFEEGTVAQKLLWHQVRKPPPIRSFRPDVPPEMEAVVEKMMAKSRLERFQTPKEVIGALSAWTWAPIPPPSEAEMPPKRKDPQAILRRISQRVSEWKARQAKAIASSTSAPDLPPAQLMSPSTVKEDVSTKEGESLLADAEQASQAPNSTPTVSDKAKSTSNLSALGQVAAGSTEPEAPVAITPVLRQSAAVSDGNPETTSAQSNQASELSES
ncbi:MAG: serine/threonine-protein kinase [Gemmatales bacterium]|nr:serine/threonine protein kinase [Gemmatales bacterium]MDW7993698.1 serine/threonine-protein kinase [Gemmatales bacterium]